MVKLDKNYSSAKVSVHLGSCESKDTDCLNTIISKFCLMSTLGSA